MPGPDTPKVEKKWFTYITMVKFYQGKTWDQLKTYLDTKTGTLNNNEVRILAAFQTYGQPDAVVLWQANPADPNFAKKFWNNPITDFGTTETLTASPSDVW